jgi:hypothetical protein
MYGAYLCWGDSLNLLITFESGFEQYRCENFEEMVGFYERTRNENQMVQFVFLIPILFNFFENHQPTVSALNNPFTCRFFHGKKNREPHNTAVIIPLMSSIDGESDRKTSLLVTHEIFSKRKKIMN